MNNIQRHPQTYTNIQNQRNQVNSMQVVNNQDSVYNQMLKETQLLTNDSIQQANNQSSLSNSTLQVNQEGQIQQIHIQRSFQQLPAIPNQTQVQIMAHNSNSQTLPLQNMTNIIQNNQQVSQQQPNLQQQNMQIQQQQQQNLQQQQPIIIQLEDGSQLVNQGYILQPNQSVFIQSNNANNASLRQSQIFQNLNQQQQQQQQQQIIHQQSQQQNNINQQQLLVQQNPVIQIVNNPLNSIEVDIAQLEFEQQQQQAQQQQLYLSQLQPQQIALQQQQFQQQPVYILQQNQQNNQHNSNFVSQNIPPLSSPSSSASQKGSKFSNSQVVASNQQMTQSQINYIQQNSTGNSRIKQIYNSPQLGNVNTVQSNPNILHNSRYILSQPHQAAPLQLNIQQQPLNSQITLLNDQQNQWNTQGQQQTSQEKLQIQGSVEQLELENRQLKNKINQLEEQQKETTQQYSSQKNYLQDLEKKIKMLIQQNEKLQSAQEDGQQSQQDESKALNQLKQENTQLKEEVSQLQKAQKVQTQQNEEQIKILVTNLESKMQELIVENQRINQLLQAKQQQLDQFSKLQESYNQLQRQNSIFNTLINEGQNEYKLKIQNLEAEKTELKLTVKELRARVKQTEGIPDLEIVVKDFEQKINQLVDENNRLNSIIESLEARVSSQQSSPVKIDQQSFQEQKEKMQELIMSNKDLKEQSEYWKKKCVELERKKLNESIPQRDSNPSSQQNSATKINNNSMTTAVSEPNIQQSEHNTNDKILNNQNSKIIDLETKLNFVLKENEKLNNILTEQISITQSLAKNLMNHKQNKSQKQQNGNQIQNNNPVDSKQSASSTKKNDQQE
ncbi:hypothetical protein ABPG74_011838 [Tetrahymena malaccensis]